MTNNGNGGQCLCNSQQIHLHVDGSCVGCGSNGHAICDVARMAAEHPQYLVDGATLDPATVGTVSLASGGVFWFGMSTPARCESHCQNKGYDCGADKNYTLDVGGGNVHPTRCVCGDPARTDDASVVLPPESRRYVVPGCQNGGSDCPSAAALWKVEQQQANGNSGE